MQIIRGRFRHRKLLTNHGDTTRPITSRVKKSLFDRLQPLLEGARVADVFAGTGTLGLEALSRGATRVLFVEQDAMAFDLLQKNVAALQVQGETFRWRTDAARCSYKPRSVEGFLPLDLIFFDPPYDLTRRMTSRTLLYRSVVRLARPEISSPDVRLLLRCARGTEFDMPECWSLITLMIYNNMAIHIFGKTESMATGHQPELLEDMGDEVADGEDDGGNDSEDADDGVRDGDESPNDDPLDDDMTDGSASDSDVTDGNMAGR